MLCVCLIVSVHVTLSSLLWVRTLVQSDINSNKQHIITEIDSALVNTGQ